MFDRGSLDVFILTDMPDVGPFKHIFIGHDGRGPDPGELGDAPQPTVFPGRVPKVFHTDMRVHTSVLAAAGPHELPVQAS